jgi:hypothetical protein
MQSIPLPSLKGFRSARVPACEAKNEYELFQFHHGLERWGVSVYRRAEWPTTGACIDDDDDDPDTYWLNADELA